MGVRPSHRLVCDHYSLSGADDRLRFVEDCRRPQAPHAGNVCRSADAGRIGEGTRPSGTADPRPSAAGSDRLEKRSESGVQRKRPEREASGRPRHQRRGAERCRGRSRAAHAGQPRSLRAGAGRRARPPRAQRRRGGRGASGPQGQGARYGVVLADRSGAYVAQSEYPGLPLRGRGRRGRRNHGKPRG